MFQLPLTFRVLSIALLGALGVAGLAGVFQWSSDRLTAASQDEDVAVHRARTATDARIELDQILNDYRSALLDPTPEIVDAISAQASSLMALSPEFQAEVGRVENADAIPPALALLVDSIKVRGFDEKTGAQGALRVSAHEIEQAAQDSGAPPRLIAPMMVELLMLRRHEKDFIMRQTQKYVDRFNKRIDDFMKTEIPASPLSPQARDAVTAAAVSYQRDFQAYADATFALSEASRQVEDSVSSALAELDVFRRDADAAAEAAVTRASEVEAWGERVVSISAPSAIVIVLLLGLLIGRSIRKPIFQLTRSVHSIAEGRLDDPAPQMQRRDVIGEMARSIEALRRVSLRAREMEAEQEKSEARLEERRKQIMRDLQANFSGAVDAAVAGDFSVRLSVDDPELAELAESVNALMTGVGSVIGDVNNVMSGLAEGDLDARMDGQYAGAFAELQGKVEITISKLAQIVGQISTSTEAMYDQTQGIAAESTQLSERAVAQAAALEETAATVEQVSAAVAANADNAVRANGLADSSRAGAEKGRAVASDAAVAMRRIEESSKKISEFVTLIDEIAFQTNLLALNAAVEAARAGDAGKGFAVVAQEVRLLAQRSADSAREIRGIITDAGTRVEEGVTLVETLGGALDDMSSSIGGVADAMGAITVASQEQASGLRDASRAITELDGITQRNASMADSGARASQDLIAKADELTDLVSYFRLSNAQRAASARHDAA